MAKRTRVKVKEKGATELVKVMTGFGRRILRIGLIGDGAAEPKKDSPEGSDLTVVDVGTFHEFGKGDNPERSFIRAWFDGNKPASIRDIKKMSEQVALGRLTFEQGMGIVGAKFVGQMQKMIAAGIDPPLKDETIRRKKAEGRGGSTPLIASGQLRSSITWDVVKS